MDELVKANQRALDLQYQLTDSEEELDRLRKIAACFEKGDYVTAKGLADRITYAGLQVYPEEWSFLRRSMQAARLAEDGA